MRLFLLLPVLFIASLCCVADEAPPEEVPRPNYETFIESVQPILIGSCGNPSACHGSAARPFSLYVPGAHRERPGDVYATGELTPQEMRANYDRARSFALDVGSGPLLLTKPLAEEAGGVRHLEGGDIFFSREERHFRVIQDWIEEKEEP